MDLNKVDLNKVAVFCQVVESGNYRRASEALNVTPSALSQTIAGLEYSLGFPLFHRVGKRLVPTQSGLRIHREFRVSQAGFMSALNELADAKKGVSGLLRIGAYLEFAKSQLAPLMASFLRDYPDVQAKLTFDAPTRLQDLLEADQLDLCFSVFPSQGSKGIASKPVIQQELVLAAPKGLLPEAPTFEQAMSVPFIEYYFNHQPVRRWLSLHYQRRPKEIPVRAYASTSEMVLSLIAEGAGAGIVPLYLLNDRASRKEARVIRPTPAKLTDHIWLLEKTGRAQSPAHAAFRARMDEHFAQRPRSSPPSTALRPSPQ